MPNESHLRISRRALLAHGVPALACVIASPARAATTIAREINSPQPGPGWATQRKDIERAWLDILGDFPNEIPPLRPKMKEVARERGVTRYHVSFQSEPDDRVTAWLLVPDSARRKPAPGIITLHSTTFGTGKDSTVGLAGMFPGTPNEQWTRAYRNPEVGNAYGRDLAEHGYVTLSIDLLTDGERIPEGGRVCDTRWFYRKHPEWSMVGKAIWDIMRSVDYLQSLDFVDGRQIGCTGWSLGGHYTLFAAAFEPRITAAIPNGGVLDWHLYDKSDAWSRKPPTWEPWKKGDPVGGIADFERRFGQNPNSGPYVYIKKFRAYIDDPGKAPPVDFEHLMMMVAPRPLMILSSEQEFYRHRILPKCLKAVEFYMNWQDVEGQPSAVAARKARRGYDRTVDYYQFHNGITPARLDEQLRALHAGDCFSWFSFPGGHSTPPAALHAMFAWFDRWLGPSGEGVNAGQS
jgi:dienelactone hydrolase